MKKIKFLMLIFIMLLIILFPLTINAVQINTNDYSVDEPAYSKGMYRFGAVIASTIQIIGTIVSAGTMIIIGIRYVVGSSEEKAEFKERMLPYLIGAMLLFGATNAVKILYEVFK